MPMPKPLPKSGEVVYKVHPETGKVMSGKVSGGDKPYIALRGNDMPAGQRRATLDESWSTARPPEAIPMPKPGPARNLIESKIATVDERLAKVEAKRSRQGARPKSKRSGQANLLTKEDFEYVALRVYKHVLEGGKWTMETAHCIIDAPGFEGKAYDHLKTYSAAPPDVLTVNEKHLRHYALFNVCGVVITPNHRTDGIYLPADDRRHFVAWSEASKEEFAEDYWTRLWDWYGRGGISNVAAHLQTLDLSRFDAKAPPPKTAAFHAIIDAGRAPEDSELADAIEHVGNPDAVTLETIIANARALRLNELANDLADRKARRAVPHKLERVGQVASRNPDAVHVLWKVSGRRQVVYGKADLPYSRQVRAARDCSIKPVTVSLVGEVSDLPLPPLASSRARFASDSNSKKCPEEPMAVMQNH